MQARARDVVSDVDIVIVGAGAAGIAAGRSLAAAGRPALVLEARDRVGGRAWTETTTFGFPVDMGCAWLHSADQQSVDGICARAGFRDYRTTAGLGRVHRARARLPEQEREEWRAAFVRNEALLVEAARRGIDVAIAEVCAARQIPAAIRCSRESADGRGQRARV